MHVSYARGLTVVKCANVLDFIENDTAGLVYAEQTNDCRDHDEQAQQLPVGAWQAEDVMVRYPLRCVARHLCGLLLLSSIWRR